MPGTQAALKTLRNPGNIQPLPVPTFRGLEARSSSAVTALISVGGLDHGFEGGASLQRTYKCLVKACPDQP